MFMSPWPWLPAGQGCSQLGFPANTTYRVIKPLACSEQFGLRPVYTVEDTGFPPIALRAVEEFCPAQCAAYLFKAMALAALLFFILSGEPLSLVFTCRSANHTQQTFLV